MIIINDTQKPLQEFRISCLHLRRAENPQPIIWEKTLQIGRRNRQMSLMHRLNSSAEQAMCWCAINNIFGVKLTMSNSSVHHDRKSSLIILRRHFDKFLLALTNNLNHSISSDISGFLSHAISKTFENVKWYCVKGDSRFYNDLISDAP